MDNDIAAQAELLLSLYGGLARLGPGSDEATQRAWRHCGTTATPPLILDVGCGTGAQSLRLAEWSGGTIVAVDLFPGFLARLMVQARHYGLDGGVRPIAADMSALPFCPGAFDIVWAEGSAYLLGFGQALDDFGSLLKPGGWLAISEIAWLRPGPPAELKAFWERSYPAMTTSGENARTVSASGLTLIDHFVLPPETWLENYYRPITRRLPAFVQEHVGNPMAESLAAEMAQEIDLYRRYSEFYSYDFFVCRRLAGDH